MKTIIAGSRDITDYAKVRDLLDFHCIWFWVPTLVLSGGARGVDTLGERWAQERGIQIDLYPADADALIAFWDGRSRGTEMMIEVMESWRPRKRYEVYRI